MPNNLYYVTFTTSDSMFDDDGPLYGCSQTARLTLGPFPEYVELTYASLRVGPHGAEIAAFDEGYWRVGLEHVPADQRLPGTTAFTDGLIFSDIAITSDPPTRSTDPQRVISMTVPKNAYDASKAAIALAQLRPQLRDTPGSDPAFLRSLLAQFVEAIDSSLNVASHGDYYRLVLELSTAHITVATNQALAEHLADTDPTASAQPSRPDGWPTVIRTGYGYMIHVPANSDDGEDCEDIPDDLRALLEHAYRNTAAWLMLDQDGPVASDLPTYPWQ